MDNATRARCHTWSFSPTMKELAVWLTSEMALKGLAMVDGEVVLSSRAAKNSRWRCTRSRSPIAVARVRT